MKTTYYLVTGAAVAVAALVVYAQLPNLNGPLPPVTAAPTEAPRLPLPLVPPPPDEPLVMPAAPAKSEEELPRGAAPAVTPVGYTEPVVPVPPAPDVPPVLPPVPMTGTEAPPVPVPPSVPLAPVPAVPAPTTDPVPPIPAPAVPVTPAPPDTPPTVPPVTPVEPLVPPIPAPTPAPKPSALTPPAKPQPLPAPAPVLQPPVPSAPAPLAPAVVGEEPKAESLPGTKYIVLKDDKLIEGTVTVRGDVVVVRQGALDRPFPKGQVQYVGESKDEVYKFQLAKVPATDAAARLKVARWCMFSGMREQALAEAREVQKLQPANGDAAGLVRSLELSLKQFPPADAPKMTAPAAPTFPTELSAKPTPPAAPAEAELAIPAEAVKLFATKVQPILANQCVDCHAKPDAAGSFKLVRVDPAGAPAKDTRANLAAVLGQLWKPEPAASPLLLKSVQAHGGQKVASLARHAAAYQTLEAWVALAIGTPAPAAPTAAVPPLPPGAPPVIPVPATPALPPVGAPAIEPVLPPVGPTPAPAVPPVPVVPAPGVEPVLPPAAPPAVPAIPPAPVVPAPPMIPAADPLFPAVPPAAPMLPKPPAAPAVPPIPPASGFGDAIPPKPPVAGSAGDEFDPAGFNQPVPKK